MGSEMCIRDRNPWAITAVLLCTAVQQFLLFRVLVHTLSEGARPTQGLIIVSRVRRRDMARSFDSVEGSSVSDSIRLVSMPTTRSSAVLRCCGGEDVRIGWEIGSLRICSLLRASSRALRCGEKKSNKISARLLTNHRERPGHLSAIHLNISFLCFRLRLATLT